MTLKSDPKLDEILTSYFKNDNNFVNFDPSTKKFRKYTF